MVTFSLIAIIFLLLIVIAEITHRRDAADKARRQYRRLLDNIARHPPGSPERFAAAARLRDFRRVLP